MMDTEFQAKIDRDTEFQVLMLKLLKDQEEKLTKQFLEREQKLIEQHQALEKEWASFMETKTETIAQGVAEHIGKEVINVYSMKFGEDAEATQVAKDFPFVEQGQIAVQLMRDDGQIMTADEFAAKHTTTWDEFNHMGGLTTEHATQTFDPFANEQIIQAPAPTQDVKDTMTAIDYQVQNYSTVDNFPIPADTPTATQEPHAEQTPTVHTRNQVASSIKGFRGTAEASTGTSGTTAPTDDTAALKEAARAAFRAKPNLDLNKSTKAAEQVQEPTQAVSSSKKEAVKNVISYKTISPTDPRLDYSVLTEEMTKEKFKSHGKTEVLVNYFDKVRDFLFKGKTATEFRADCVEKKDYAEWLKSFDTTHKKMKSDHASEIKMQPFAATEKEERSLLLKHAVEEKFYEISEKTEMSKAQVYFPHSFKNDVSKDAKVVSPPTLKEKVELKELFQDYAADRLGGSCRTIFEENPRQAKIKKLSKSLAAPKATPEQRSKETITQRIKEMKLSF